MEFGLFALVVMCFAFAFVVGCLLHLACNMVNSLWFMPTKLEKSLREQGFTGNPYRFPYGDVMELANLVDDAKQKPMSLSDDVVPRAIPLEYHTIKKYAFGSSYQEALEIFKLQKEQVKLTFQVLQSIVGHIPGWRFLPTKRIKRMKEIHGRTRVLVMNLIDKQRKASVEDDAINEDINNKENLLGILLESNKKELEHMHEEKGSAGGTGNISMEDVVEEVKLFYLAGQDTLVSTLTWAMILLSQHQDWQQRARDEVSRLFGSTSPPDFEGLGRLQVVAMIIHEVLRLYPPVACLVRLIHEPTRIKDLSLLPGMTVYMPTILLHKDKKFWGEDADEFNPERFSGEFLVHQKSQDHTFRLAAGHASVSVKTLQCWRPRWY
ncbi:hypothetical protein Dimus_012619 [Dionaea muscipula]